MGLAHVALLVCTTLMNHQKGLLLAAATAPANDVCHNATEIISLPYQDDETIREATPDPVDAVCAVESTAKGVWYEFNGTGKVTKLSLKTGYNYKQVSVYSGNVCGDLLCEFYRRQSSGLLSHVWIPEAGVTYKLLVTEYYRRTNVGDFRLDLVDFEPPSNDECVNAHAVSGGLPFADAGDTFAALPEGDAFSGTTCQVEAASRGVWYSFVGTGNWTMIKMTAVFAYKQFAIYKGSSCNELTCVTYKRGTSANIQHLWLPQSEQTYHVLITGYNSHNSLSATGDYDLDIVDYDAPAHDECSGAINVSGLPFDHAGDTFAALYDFEDTICGVEANSRGVWYSFVGTGKWTKIRLGAGFSYKQFAIYEGSSCDDLTCLTYKRGTSATIEHLWLPEDGQTYHILVTGYNTWNSLSVAGDFSLEIVDYEAPTHDECSGAINVAGLPFDDAGDTFAATYDFEDTICGVEANSRGVWYSFVGTGKWTKIKLGAGFSYKQFAIYEGSSCDDLTCLTYKRGTPATIEHLWLPEDGQTYHILVTGYNTWNSLSVAGDYSLEIVDYEAPVHDKCSGAISAAEIPFDDAGDTFAATYEFEDTICGVEANSRGVWYSLVGTGKWTKIKPGTGFSYKQFAIYDGSSCDDLTCLAYKRGTSASIEHLWLPQNGHAYHLLITGYNTWNSLSVAGDYNVDIVDYEAPAHDKCTGAISAPELPFDHAGDTFAALYDFEDTICGVEAGSRGVWYSFVGTGKWTTTKLGAGFSYKQFAVYEGSSCNDLTCLAYKRGTSATIEYMWLPEDEQTYHVLVTGYNTLNSLSVAGDYNLDIEDHQEPANDECQNAIVAEAFPFEDDGDTFSALPDFEDSTCGVEVSARGVWYSFVGDGFTATVSLLTSFYYKHFSIYKGSCGDFVCVLYKRRTGYHTTLVHSFGTASEVRYFVFVAGYGSASNPSYGDYQIDITTTAPTPFPSPAPTPKLEVSPGLYGTSGYLGSVVSHSELYLIDLDTGASSFIGAVLVDGTDEVLIDGLSYDQHSGRMLAHTSVNSPSVPNSLVSIDVANGRARFIGTSTTGNTHGLAIKTTGQAYTLSADGDLVLVNTHTGDTAIIGATNVDLDEFGLAFDDDDILHLLNDEGRKHYVVSTLTGAATMIGSNMPMVGGIHGDINLNTYLAPTHDEVGMIQVFDLETFGVQDYVIQTGIVGLHTLAFAGASGQNSASVPTTSPSQSPTSETPVAEPNGQPSAEPSSGPTTSPSWLPSQSPSKVPSVIPNTPTSTLAPSSSYTPTTLPSMRPSTRPSENPTEGLDLDFSSGFACDAVPFSLVGSAAGYPKVMPFSEAEPERCFLRLTPDASGWRASAAFLEHVFASSSKTFSMSIDYRVYGAAAGSADGMAFVMHQDPRGEGALGSAGGAIGVHSSIRPALVIEWDTYANGCYLDNGENNIHVLVRDVGGTLTELGETLNVPIRTEDSGQSFGRMWVDYCSDQVFRVFVNNTGTHKPSTPQIEVEFDVDQIFDGDDVLVGYTAGTASEGDNHDILSWQFDENCDRLAV